MGDHPTNCFVFIPNLNFCWQNHVTSWSSRCLQGVFEIGEILINLCIPTVQRPTRPAGVGPCSKGGRHYFRAWLPPSCACQKLLFRYSSFTHGLVHTGCNYRLVDFSQNYARYVATNFLSSDPCVFVGGSKFAIGITFFKRPFEPWIPWKNHNWRIFPQS